MIPLDKQAHFWAGAAISATVTLYATPVAGIAACLIAAAAKEMVDRMGYGTPDFKDFLATAAGACVVIPVFLI